MNRDRHQSHCQHLQLIVILLLGTLALPTKQTNTTQSLRPFQTERKLQSSETLSCNPEGEICIVQRQITKSKTVYSFSIGPKADFGLNLRSDNDEDLRLVIEVQPFQNAKISLRSYEASLYHDEKFSKYINLQEKSAKVTVPGPVEDLQIYFKNELDTSRRGVTVTVYRSQTSETSETSKTSGTTNWSIPTGPSAGAFIVILVVIWACRRRRRLQRQRRNAEAIAQQYQVVELGSPPPSPRQAGQDANDNRRQQSQAQPQPQSLPKPSIQELIDVCYPEANFAEFESHFPQKTCTICLDDMQENQPCRQLDCQHVFHSKCGKQWLESQYTKQKKVFCPNCNKRVRFDVKKAAKKKKPVEAAKK